FNVQPITLAGWFDRLPRSTPHKGLFGVWNHAFPSRHPSVEPEWSRADWYDMVTAWFDRYLKGIDTGVERWPAVQIQSSNGQWWTAKEYPTIGGKAGQLALGPRASLGKKRPKGESMFIEQAQVGGAAPGQEVIFQTPRLKRPLHLTGQPVADLWLRSSRDDAHVAVKLEVLGGNGEPKLHEGSSGEAMATYGVRSMQHLAPMKRGWFEQAQSQATPVDEPFRALVRFLPTDLVVPKGGRLRLTISGSVTYSKGDSLPSGAASQVTVLHKCGRSSTLRFLVPSPRAKLINVREVDEPQPRLKSRPTRVGRKTGGGLATRKICGKGPKRVPFLR
ncbi:MAG TPA: CocE/NonD family hydrolase C-terminal non-catalytic domain-containing protein, partial [Actinomycetota bacterium]|nr:CocE/NonD family hydrolase C-terminal non-catalytic domain-containing protein [Actinomycetota bacterium]